jgi:hypothetical protein
VDDVGAPVDDFIQSAIAISASGAAASCGVIEPRTKNYWLYMNGTIFVLSRFPSAKITAWSTYEPRGNDGFLFTPDKFVVFNGLVYVRAGLKHFTYGGANGATYDNQSVVTFSTPYLDDKKPGTVKTFQAMSAVMAGGWTISFSANPISNVYTSFYSGGNPTTPNALSDSTFDTGRIPIEGLIGTHFSVKGVSNAVDISTTSPPVFGSVLVYYNQSEIP